jgi:hypothetical protein
MAEISYTVGPGGLVENGVTVSLANMSSKTGNSKNQGVIK